jgi:tRNA pseudouridine38-40 synthase
MRYFFHIGYNGHVYNGWQRHPKAHSIQQVIEDSLSKIFKMPLSVIGCGRTDTKVHASQFFFHVDIDRPLNADLLFILNKVLPHNIAIFDIIPMDGKQHARFDAVQRKYDYYWHNYKDPFLRQLSSYYPITDINLTEMKKAIKLLPKYKDYRAFCTTPDKNEHTLCNVMEAKLYRSANNEHFRFHIASNRFLSKMIRLIVGKLLKIGTNELSVAEFEHHLISKEIPSQFEVASPTGLYLSKVTYPYLNLPTKTAFGGFTQSEWIEV